MVDSQPQQHTEPPSGRISVFENGKLVGSFESWHQAVQFIRAHRLRLPLRELLRRHDLPRAELRRPLERHAELVVCREETGDVRVAPGSAVNLRCRSLSERERLVEEVLDETFGLGPLEPLMRDPTITDILINGPKIIYIEQRGQLKRTVELISLQTTS